MASSIQLLRSTQLQERPFPGNLLEGQPAININSAEPGFFFKATDGSVVKIGPVAITDDGSPPNSAPVGLSGNSAGELWLDKSVDPAVLKVYDGTAWVDAGSGGGGGGGGTASFVRWIYTATGGETSLSGISGGVLLEYTPGLEEVYVNGVLITRGTDYSATNGSSITNLAALTAGDVITVVSMNPAETVQLREFISVKDFGAVGDGVQDDTIAVQNALNALVQAGGGTLLFPASSGPYVINSVTSSASSSITLWIGGELKHIDGANGDMFEFSNMDFVRVRGGRFDGNFQNQTASVKSQILNFAGSLNVSVEGCEFVNVNKSAIYTGKFNDEADSVRISNCTFRDGVLHNGVLNDVSCTFIFAYPARVTLIENCSFIQTAAPIGTECRNPAGIFAGSSSTSKALSLSVKNCYFENLGHHAASNIAGAVDVYSYRDTVVIENNVFKSCRMLPLRVTNSSSTLISNNTIYQDVDMIVDGGTTYTSSACIVAGLITRSYVANFRDNNTYVISNNAVILSGGGVNVPFGVYAFNDSSDPAYSVKNVSIRNNLVKFSSSNSRRCIAISSLEHVVIDGNRLINGLGIFVLNTTVGSITSRKLNYQIVNNFFESDGANDRGVVSEVKNPNLSITVRACDFSGLQNSSFRCLTGTSGSVGGNLIVSENILSSTASSNGEVAYLSSFFFKDNIQGLSGYPTNLTTCTIYRSLNNTLTADKTETSP